MSLLRAESHRTQQLPRTFLRSKKVSLRSAELSITFDQIGSEIVSSVATASRRLGRCSSWLTAGIALPEDTDSPGEIKAGTETVEDTKTKAKSKNSRARRLSYVANAEGVGPQVHSSSCLLLSHCAAQPAPPHCENTGPPGQQQGLLQPALGGESAPVADKAKPAAVNITATPTIPSSSDKPRAPAQSSNTRARRLSYVTNDVSALYCIVSNLYVSVSIYSWDSSKVNKYCFVFKLNSP